MLSERNSKIREAASNSRSKLINYRSYAQNNDATGLKAKQHLKTNGRLSDEGNTVLKSTESKQKSTLTSIQPSFIPQATPRNSESHPNFIQSKQNTVKYNSAKSSTSKQTGSRYSLISDEQKLTIHSNVISIESSADRSEMDDNPSCAQAMFEVQQVWDKFVAVSTAISRLECLMVQTKIEHVLNEEYQVYYQRHPYVSDPATTLQNEDFEKSKYVMEDLRAKIVTTRELEERIECLSRAHEIIQNEMNVLITNSRTTANSLRGRSSLERAASTAIREKLAKITHEEAMKKNKLNACMAELEKLGK